MARGTTQRPGRAASLSGTPPGGTSPSAVTRGPAREDRYWFDDPIVGERRSWAIPSGHGRFRELDLELLDPADEDQLRLLLEAQHPQLAEALRGDEDVILNGEPINPRLHIAMHQIVATRLLADDPPETWPTVQRLAGLGYDWHNIMHMIAAVVSDDIHAALTDRHEFDAGEHARRLHELPGDWPAPNES